MRLLYLSIVISFLFPVIGNTQSKLGEVAAVVITTPNLDSSAAVYEKLGFPTINSNTYPFPWAQVSDGSLLIMMRQDATPFTGLTYYAADVEKIAAQLEKDGIVFTQKPKEGDPLKRYFIKTPDGFTIVLVSNIGGFQQPTGLTMLTMKPADFMMADKYPNKQCGVFGEFAQPVTDLKTSIAYWEKLGFTVKSNTTQPYPYAILTDGLMIIGLHQTTHFTYPAVTYFGVDTPKRIQQLKDKGLQNFSEIAGKGNVSLSTWEGQHFFIFSMSM